MLTLPGQQAHGKDAITLPASQRETHLHLGMSEVDDLTTENMQRVDDGLGVCSGG